jgi:pimeloyl-ACP methyl ester carboxylesterase
MKPVVLAHGYLGFGDLFHVDYFNGVKKHLEDKWGLTVFASTVGPKDRVQDRAAALETEIKSNFNGKPVHIIAHSMGGLDARYLIAPIEGKPSDLVASLTTVATPHQGTFLGDVALLPLEPGQARNNPAFQRLIIGLPGAEAQLFAGFLKHPLNAANQELREAIETARSIARNFVAGDPTPLATYIKGLFTLNDRALRDLTPAECAKLFAAPGAQRVPCFSYAAHAIPFESLSSKLLLSYMVLKAIEGENDGMVSLRSAQWAKYQGEFPADHAKVIGWGTKDHLPWYDTMIENIRHSVPDA